MYYVIYNMYYVTIPEVSCTALNVKCSSVYYVVDYVIKDKYIQYYIDYNSSISQYLIVEVVCGNSHFSKPYILHDVIPLRNI